MNKFNVIFNFDKDNSLKIIFHSTSRQAVYNKIIEHKNWFYQEDDQGVLHSVNMNMVTSFSIEEY